MPPSLCRTVASSVICLFACLVLTITAAMAQSQPSFVPRLITFSGSIADPGGKPRTGTLPLTFSIYSSPDSQSALWQETQSVTLDEHSRYSVQLGSATPEGVPSSLFTANDSLWLGVAPTGSGEPDQPRVRLVSVPYALKAGDADTLGGEPASAYVTWDSANSLVSTKAARAGTTNSFMASKAVTTVAMSTSLSPMVAGSGSANYIPLWKDGSGDLANSVMFQNTSGHIGIWTASPQEALELGSNGFVGTRVFPSDDTTSGLAGYALRSREAGGYTHTWRIYTAPVGGGYGVPPNSFAIWDYPGNPGNGSCCNQRFVILPSANGTPSTSPVAIDGTGNVGIGTTNPASLLSVGRASQFQVNSSGGLTAASASLGTPLAVFSGGTGVSTLTGLVKGNGTGALSSATAGVDYQIPLLLTTNGTGGTASLTGNVLNIPQYTYDFSSGLTNSSGTITDNLSVGVAGGQIVIGGTGAADALTLQGTTGNGTPTAVGIRFNVGNNGASNAASILNNGNVGIGTTNPASLLSVGQTSQFQVNSSGGLTAASASLGTPLAVFSGGTGVSTLTGLVKGNGTGALSSATAGVDYQIPLLLTTNGTGGTASLTGNILNIPQYTYDFSSGLTNSSGTITDNLSVGVAGGQIVIGGTGAADALTLQGTTGIGAPTAVGIRFNVGNNGASNAASILNNGNVGIGTTNPASLLSVGQTSQFQVNSSGGLTAASASLGTPLAVFSGGTGVSTLTGLVKGNGTGALSSATAGVDYQIPLLLTTNGTGGTASLTGNILNIPQYTYDFSSGLTNSSGTITDNLSVGVAGGQIVIGGTGAADALTLQGTTGIGAPTAVGIRFNVGNNGASNAASILNNGNVGIGTSNPANGQLVISSNRPNNATYNYLVFDNQASGYGDWKVMKSGANDLAFAYDVDHGNTTNYAMTLQYGGKIGIGTLTPTASLEVNGTTKFDGYVTFPGGQSFPGTLTKAASGGGLQVSGGSNIGLTTSCAYGQVLAWSGTAWQCANGAVTTSASNGAVNVSGLGTGTATTLGSNLLTNGNFATDDCTAWVCGAGWSIINAAAVHSVSYTDSLSQTITVTPQTVYQILFTQTGATTGSVTYSIGSLSMTIPINEQVWNGATLVNTTQSGPVTFAVTPSNNYNGTLTGFAVQSVTAANPILKVQNSNGSVGWSVTSGNQGNNIFLGNNAGVYDTSGTSNLAVGNQTLNYLTGGWDNTAIGQQALANTSMASKNTAVGASALMNDTTGSEDTAVGSTALYSNATGIELVAIGQSALYSNTTGSDNVGVGVDAIGANTTGFGNVGVGTSVLYSADGTTYNTAMGDYAMHYTTEGSNNTGIGSDVLYSTTTGYGDTALGSSAGFLNTLGSQNVFIGMAAGFTATPANANVTGSNNVFVGYNSGPDSSAQLNNSIAIGNQALVHSSNTAVIGSASTTDTYFGSTSAASSLHGAGATFSGLVGIGTTSPAANLEVTGTAQFDGVVTFANSGQSFPGTLSGAIAGGGLAVVGSTIGLTTACSPGQVLSWSGSAWPCTTVPQLTVSNQFTVSTAGATAMTVQATDTSAANTAVDGVAAGPGGTGVIGEADNGVTAIGILGTSSSGLAGKFIGDVNITGNLSKSGGSFKIDDPVDPANKYLYHSFVESPDMKNIYDGVVVLDQNGEATIQLPDWFQSLNRDFRYQLTCVGAFAPVYVSQEISNNRFGIAGGKQGMKISWQVTGIRQDSWANAHRIPVEQDKPSNERGYYLHPELANAPPSKNVLYANHLKLAPKNY